MTIAYEVTEEDYVNFNLYHIQHSPSQKNWYNTIRFVLPVLSMPVIYFTGTLVFNQPRILWMITAVLFYIYWINSYPKQHKKTVRKQTVKLLNEGDNSSLFGKKSLEIVGDNLIFTEESATSTLSKRGVKSIKESDDMLILYVSAVSAIIIPKRYLSDQDIRDIRAVIKFG